jgi:hypothetical protein
MILLDDNSQERKRINLKIVHLPNHGVFILSLMEKLEKIITGQELDKKVKAFNAGIEQIEKKNQEFFSGRVSKHIPLSPDRLKNYFTLDYNSSRGRITFNDAQLPVCIRVEVEELFDKIWS